MDSASRPLWSWTDRPTKPLSGAVETEFAVVGAGIGGLSTALHLAAMGRDVVVIDGAIEHWDGAGASAGIIAPQLVRNSPHDVLRKLGREPGERLLRMVAESGKYAFGFISGHRLACQASNNGFLAPLTGNNGFALTEQWKPFRSDLEWLGESETAALTGCKGYLGAIYDPSGGTVDPVALLQGLERDCGARLFRASAATRIAEGEVITAGGSVRARHILLCANGGNAGLDPRLQGSVLPLPVYEVATVPIPREMRTVILPHGHAMTDISTDVFSLRYDRDGRLITALPAAQKLSAEEIEVRVNRRLVAMLQVHQPLKLDYVWHGTAWLNPNLLPRATVLDRGLTALQACNGRGLANNLIAGRELARWLTDPNYVPLLPFGKPSRLPAYGLLKYLPRLMMAGSALLRRTHDH